MNAITELKSLEIPDESTINRGASAALKMAETFVVSTADDYALAADELRACKAKLNELNARRLSITRPMDAAKAAVMALFAGPIQALEKAEDIYKSGMLTYKTEQDRIAAEARRRAEEAAAAERRRLEQEAAERQRQADAERARLEAEARTAAEAGDARAAEQAQQQAAQVAQTAALEVAAIENTAQVIVAAAPVVAPIKASGTSVRESFDFEVTDLHALVKHVGEHPELLSLLRADEVKLRAYVRGLGRNTNLPGVRVDVKRTLAARAA